MTKGLEFDVFLSHNSADKPVVELIAQRLKSEFGLNPFLDKWNLIPGKTWPKELERALDESATAAVFLGPGGKGPWHNEEMQLALFKAVHTREEYRIIPVLLPGADDSQVGGSLGLRTWVDFRGGVDDELAFKRLVGGIKGEAIDSGGFELPDEPAPYRGLSRFEKAQADYFFGRIPDIERLIAKLGNEGFVAVIGASGSGKSSLARAGLLPRLDEGALPGSRTWRVIVFRPGSEPLRALANQLLNDLPKIERADVADRLVAQLGKGEDGLRNTLTSWYADAPAPLLLIIDQFEELFTQCNAETRSSKVCREAARALITGLADLVRSGGGETRVLITLRADFLDRCLEFPVLRELLQDGQLLLGELGDEALRQAIVMPAQKVGAFFEKGLVNLILRDVTGERGSLPLLQHALFELWKARRGPWLTLAAYEQSGGVTGALKGFAQRIYDGLKADEQTIARNIFVRITSLGEGVSDTRRRVPRGDLYPVGVDTETVDRVIEKLSGKKARLIVAGDEGVEVTHESLLKEWDTLRGWLGSNRDAQRLRQQITEAATLWKSARADDDSGRDYLFTGARLELAEQWVLSNPATLTALEKEFLDASGARRDAERDKEEQARLERERLLGQKAKLAQQKARQERKAKREMAVLLRELNDHLITASVNLAQVYEEKAVGILNKPEEQRGTRDYQFALLQALEAQRQRIGGRRGLKSSTQWRLWAGGLGKAFEERWASPSRDLYGRISVIAFSPDGRQLAVASDDKTVRLCDAATGKAVRTLEGHQDVVISVAFSHNGRLLAGASADKTVRLWNPATGEAVRTLEGHQDAVICVAFSPDGRLLASASADKTLRLWDPTTGEAVRTLEGHQDAVISVAFSHNGRLLAGASADKTVRLWNPATGEVVRTLDGHQDAVISVAFSPDGRLLASASADKTLRLWDPATGEAVRTLEGHQDAVISVAFSHNGRLLAGASADKTVRLWDPATGEAVRTLEGHQDAVISVAFSHNGRLLASASADKTIRLWDPATGDAFPALCSNRT